LQTDEQVRPLEAAAFDVIRHWLFTGRKKSIVYWIGKLQPFFRIAVYFIEIAKIQWSADFAFRNRNHLLIFLLGRSYGRTVAGSGRLANGWGAEGRVYDHHL